MTSELSIRKYLPRITELIKEACSRHRVPFPAIDPELSWTDESQSTVTVYRRSGPGWDSAERQPLLRYSIDEDRADFIVWDFDNQDQSSIKVDEIHALASSGGLLEALAEMIEDSEDQPVVDSRTGTVTYEELGLRFVPHGQLHYRVEGTNFDIYLQRVSDTQVDIQWS